MSPTTNAANSAHATHATNATYAATSTREVILDAALAEIAETNVDRATVAAICRRAGVSNGSFFHFFATKDALLEALHERAIGAYQQAYLDLLASSGESAEAAVRSAVRFHLEWVEKRPELAQFMQRPPHPRQQRPRARRMSGSNSGFIGALTAWARPYQQRGEMRDIPPEVLASALLGPPQLLCRAWLSGVSDVPPSHYSQSLGDVVWASLVVFKTTAKRRKPRDS
jgi:AcrR family transcriptional regulator